MQYFAITRARAIPRRRSLRSGNALFVVIITPNAETREAWSPAPTLIGLCLVYRPHIRLPHTYIPLTLYPQRGTRVISGIPSRRPTKLPKWLCNEEYCRRDRWYVIRRLIAFYLSKSAVNPLVAFYDIHGRKGEVPFFYIVPDTTQDHEVATNCQNTPI
jgi:hypothetical protein